MSSDALIARLTCNIGLHFYKRIPDEIGGYGMGGEEAFDMRACRLCGFRQNRFKRTRWVGTRNNGWCADPVQPESAFKSRHCSNDSRTESAGGKRRAALPF